MGLLVGLQHCGQPGAPHEGVFMAAVGSRLAQMRLARR